jgi:hypothetical protein
MLVVGGVPVAMIWRRSQPLMDAPPPMHIIAGNFVVIVSRLDNGNVVRRRFQYWHDAKNFADRFVPAGMKASKGFGYRVEIHRMEDEE